MSTVRQSTPGYPGGHVAAPQRSRRGLATGGITSLILLANVAAIVVLWLRDGGISGVHGMGDAFTSLGRITGLLGAYLLLIQMLLLARLRRIERLVGLDRLTVWHKYNGQACLYLVLAHVVFITIGYAMLDQLSIAAQITSLLGTYTDMIQATIGTALIVLVAVSSLVVVRSRLPYETWYFVHLTAYAGNFLGWLHQIPTGNEFLLNSTAAAYWTALYVVTLALVILFRFAQPVYYTFWYQLRVAEVSAETHNVVSLRITGRHLDRMGARAGQFFLWRFMTPTLVWQSHPFSLSAVPDGQSLRITVKSLGDFTSRIGELRPGTRVLGEGPFGLFTEVVRQRERVVLIAGGVGITAIRSLLEEMSADVVLIYRVVTNAEIVFREELETLSHDRGIRLCYVTGDHRVPGAERLMSPDHLRELVPDIDERDVYVCGPPAMSSAVQANVRQAGVPRKQIHTESFAY